MRVLIVCVNRGLAGPTRHVHHLIKSIGDGAEVALAARAGGWLAGRVMQDFPSVNCFPLALSGSLQNPVATLKLACLARRGGYDLIHTQGSHGTRYGLTASWLTGIPVVATAHSLMPDSMPVFRKARSVIAVAHAVKGVLMQEGLKEDNIHVVWNGIHVEEFDSITEDEIRVARQELAIPDGVPVIATFGRTSRTKGHDTFFKAAVQIHRSVPNAHFLLLGRETADFAPQLHEIINKGGIRDVVRFPGHRYDMARLLHTIDVAVTMSRSEAFGIVCLECMACRVPVVASRIGGLVEIVAEGETGFLLPPEDDHALAERVVELLEDATTRKTMGLRGRERLERCFTARQMAASTLQVYREVGGNGQ